MRTFSAGTFKCLATAAALALLTGNLKAMSLGEAVGYALEHNREILTVKERINERNGQVLEVRADAFPQLNVNATGYRVRDPGFLNSTFGQQILKGGGGGEDMGIPIDAIMPKPQTFYDVNLSFSQPLFTWGKVTNAVKIAKMGIQDINLELETKRQDVALRVTQAYYNVLLAEETVSMYEKSLEVQERYLKQTTDYFDLGDATRLDVLRAEAALASTRPDLLQARHDLVQAKKELNFQLGRSLDEDITTAPVEFDDTFQTPPLDSVVAVSLQQRPDLRQLDVQVEMLSRTINVFKADMRPRVDLAGHYGYSTIRRQDLLDRNFESWRVALDVKVPLFDGLRNRGQVRQYRSQQSQREIQSSDLSQRIRLDALQSLDACSAALEVYQSRQVSLQSSEEEERVTADNYEQGLVTLYELLDSNRRVVEARKYYLQARYTLLQEIASLKRVMGVPADRLFEIRG